MNVLADRLHTWLAALLHLAGPTLVSGIAGALLGMLLVLTLVAMWRLLMRLRATRSVNVAVLAAGGISRPEIARRTGLSQDAVAMLLTVRRPSSGRRKVPATARTAGLQRAPASHRSPDWNAQVIAVSRDRSGRTGGREAARPLPSSRMRFSGLTRSGQMA